MGTEFRARAARLAFSWAAAAAPLAAASSDALARDAARWEQVPLPAGAPEVTDIGVEPGGDLWAVLGANLHYWDGSGLRPVDPSDLAASPYRFFLYGGGDRPLFAARAALSENAGTLYRLSDGRALLEADYYQDHPHAPPSVYVSRTGQLLHWGDRFLAVRRGGAWGRIEARLHHKESIVVETGAAVFLYYNRHLYSVDREGRIGAREIDCPVVSVPNRNRLHGVLWGEDRLFLFEDGAQAVHAFSLETGARIDVSRLDAFLERRRAHDLFGLPDGSVWIVVHEFDTSRFALWAIPPEGEPEPTGDTEILGWRNLRRWQYPRCVLPRADGTIWFGTPRDGIARSSEGRTERFDWRQGIGG